MDSHTLPQISTLAGVYLLAPNPLDLTSVLLLLLPLVNELPPLASDAELLLLDFKGGFVALDTLLAFGVTVVVDFFGMSVSESAHHVQQTSNVSTKSHRHSKSPIPSVTY